MTRRKVNDYEWHDVDYGELPGWVKRRIGTLHRRQLVGRHFRYRLVAGPPGRYQKRLRHHIPVDGGTESQRKQVRPQGSPASNRGRSPGLLCTFKATLLRGYGSGPWKHVKGRGHRRGFVSWTALPMLLFMAASIAIAVYAYANLEEFGRPAAIGIMTAAVIVAIWSAAKLRQLWLYRPWSPSLSRVLLVAVIVALLGCTTAAYSHIEPLSTAKTSVVSWFSKAGETVGGWFEEKPISEVESEALELVNVERANRGIPPLQWDESLHEIAREHSQAMADRGSMFHSSVSAPYAENCWWSGGSIHNASAHDIVTSWMGSDKHRTWLLCPNLKHAAAGIVESDEGLWASWTFWRNETTHSDWWYSNGGTPPPWWH